MKDEFLDILKFFIEENKELKRIVNQQHEILTSYLPIIEKKEE